MAVALPTGAAALARFCALPLAVSPLRYATSDVNSPPRTVTGGMPPAFILAFGARNRLVS